MSSVESQDSGAKIKYAETVDHLAATPVASLLISLLTAGVAYWYVSESESPDAVAFLFTVILTAIATLCSLAWQAKIMLKKLVAKHDLSKPVLVTEETMYSGMVRALELDRPDNIWVTSFRPFSPQGENAPAVVKRYHDELGRYLATHPFTELRRVIAVHTIDKLKWLKKLVDDYGSDKKNEANERCCFTENSGLSKRLCRYWQG